MADHPDDVIPDTFLTAVMEVGWDAGWSAAFKAAANALDLKPAEIQAALSVEVMTEQEMRAARSVLMWMAQKFREHSEGARAGADE